MINNEYASLFALRQLRNSQNKIQKSIQRLSSGKAINQAADNPSGLCISEKLKSIMNGTVRASQNVQDGISFLQTGDGGLNEIMTIIQRERELVIKAANDTLTSQDRNAIQTEIDQLNDEIDKIANHTEFNTIKPLRPPIKKTSSAGGKADIVFIIDATGSMGSYIANVKSNINSFADTLSSEGIDYSLGLVVYRDISDPSSALIKFSFTDDPDVFKNQLDTISATGGGDLSESGLEAIEDASLGALSYSFRSDASKQFVLVTDATVHDKDSDGLSSYSLSAVADELASKKIKTSIVSNTASESQLHPLASASGGQYLDINASFASSLNTIAGDVIDDTDESASIPDIKLQIGANAGNTATLSLFDARSAKLGINTLSVKTRTAAESAINTLDQTMDRLSAARSRYGSYISGLQHTSNNLAIYNENLTAAQSRITDTDMAKETAELTMNRIQEQTSEAMAAQAASPSKVLLKLLE